MADGLDNLRLDIGLASLSCQPVALMAEGVGGGLGLQRLPAARDQAPKHGARTNTTSPGLAVAAGGGDALHLARAGNLIQAAQARPAAARDGGQRSVHPAFGCRHPSAAGAAGASRGSSAQLSSGAVQERTEAVKRAGPVRGLVGFPCALELICAEELPVWRLLALDAASQLAPTQTGSDGAVMRGPAAGAGCSAPPSPIGQEVTAECGPGCTIQAFLIRIASLVLDGCPCTLRAPPHAIPAAGGWQGHARPGKY